MTFTFCLSAQAADNSGNKKALFNSVDNEKRHMLKHFKWSLPTGEASEHVVMYPYLQQYQGSVSLTSWTESQFWGCLGQPYLPQAQFLWSPSALDQPPKTCQSTRLKLFTLQWMLDLRRSITFSQMCARRTFLKGLPSFKVAGSRGIKKDKHMRDKRKMVSNFFFSLMGLKIL